MRRNAAASLLLAAILLTTGCSASDGPEQQTTSTGVSASSKLVPGYTGGCEEGFIIVVQNQFNPLGTKIRRSSDGEVVNAGLTGNEELRAIGWIDTGEVIYPENPPELQGKVWFYVRELEAWVPDAGVRATPTKPAPGDDDKYFDPATQAPQRPDCKLSPV